ncbi:hypothetical protein OHA72_61305 [Dactylosporangium sp. NBC_01737]|uniref:hypothetical protein n=1 Tax=Dactylosporangium sp. NBC_01737 TaxID=2975959 RepID=UPI002E14966B|nr:hypothetical protein OHA72_61305 [Dactylosporangium sp. NBC_01737]
MQCPRCGAIGVDAQGLCLRCRLYVGAPAGPPRLQRNPLLIPGIVFAVVAVLLITAVIVYAATGGDQPAEDTAAQRPAAPATTGATSTAPSPSAGSSPSAGPSATASPSPSADTCIVGVWLEERHDENMAILNTGVFPFHGSGTYHRYNDSGRVVFDYGSGVRMTGAKGSTTYEFVFTGIIVYSYVVENGQVVYSNPRADGTETLFRNGHQDYTSKLEARSVPPRKLNCGSVAMSLTTPDVIVELKRTSARQ